MYIEDFDKMTAVQQARALASEASQVYADAETRIDERLAEMIEAVCMLVERVAEERSAR